MRSPSMRMPGHRRAAIAQRADRAAASSAAASTRSYVDRLELQRGFDSGARMRAGQHVEGGLAARHRAAEHNARRCCSSSTSATPRPISARSAARSCSSTGASPPCAQSTADELGAALRNLLELRGCCFERPRRLDRLLDGAPARARVDGDGRALPRPRDARRRPGDEDGDGDPLRQPARDRRRPARQRGGDPRALRWPGGVRRLRHGDDLRRRLRRGRVPRRRR